jgi:hypothetical protein
MSTVKAAAAVAALAVVACADDPYRLDAPRSGAGVELAPYTLHEECFTLDAGERVAFHFESVAPVAFNIHYHEGNAVIMPIERAHATQESGNFNADRREVYCMMWETGAEPTLLDYGVRPLPRRP